MKSSRRTAATRLTDLKCSKCCGDDLLLSLNCGHLICHSCSAGLEKCYVCRKKILGDPELWPQHIHAKRLVDIAKNSFSKAEPCRNKGKRPRQALSDDESNKNTRRTKAKTNSNQNKFVAITDLSFPETPLIIDGHIPVEVRRSSRFSTQPTYYYPKLKHVKSVDVENSDFLSLSCSEYSNTSDLDIKCSPSISSFLKIIQKTDFKSDNYVRLSDQGSTFKTPSKPNLPIVAIKHATTFAPKFIECGVQVTPGVNFAATQTEEISFDLSDCKDIVEDPLVLNLSVETEKISNKIESTQEPKIQSPTIVESFNLDSDSDSNGETPCNQTINIKNCLAIESSSEDEEKINTLTNDTQTSSSDEEIDSSDDRSLVPFKFKGRTKNETLLSRDYVHFEVKTRDPKHPIMKLDFENFVVEMFPQPQNDISLKEHESPFFDDLKPSNNQVSPEAQSISITENSDSTSDLLELNNTPRWIINALQRNKRIVKRSIKLQVCPNPLEQILPHVPSVIKTGRLNRHSYPLKKVSKVVNLVEITLQKFKQLNIDSRPTINHDCVQNQLRRLRLPENEDCIVFADDGLQPDERLDLMEYIQSHNFEYSETINRNTSFLIVRNQFDESMKTFKFLMAIAHKKPIVTTDYFYNSIRCDRLLSIPEYILNLPGPQSCTLLTRLPIFSEFVFHVIDGLLMPSTEEIKELLITCGATLVEKLEDILNFKNRCKVQIIDYFRQPVPEFETICLENSITRVDFGWVRESVFYYKLLPLEQYISCSGPV